MQPTLCSKCKKNLAVIFISRIENGVTKNEGLCLKCAREMGVQPVDDMMKRMGITDEDLDNLTDEMMNMFQNAEGLEGLIPQNPEEGEEDPETGLVPLGDMCVSLERAAAQAEEFGHSVERELSYLTVHSVLHLLGYDHLDEGPMKARMRAREEAILEGLGITRETEQEAQP